MSAVAIDDLFCLYRSEGGDVAALRGLSLNVAQGERVLVHGPSGSGKTTLMRVITGFVRPSAGSATVLGHEIHRLSPRARAAFRRRSLGLIDQGRRRALRDELSVVENVALQLTLLGEPRRESLRRALLQLDRLRLADLADRRPVELSGGQAQRVALSAALVHRPSLILADEPTGELDLESADEVYALLGELAQELGSTLVIVSHDPQAARIADRMVRIRDGRLSEEREPAEGEQETLVIDHRGWLRLPDELRRSARLGERVHAVGDGGAIVLRAARTADAGVLAVPPVSAPRAPGAVVARLSRVARSYGATRVLAPLDLEIRAAELTVVHGRSGSGKTTLLRLLAGLERPSEGSVEVVGIALADLDRAGLAELRRMHLALAAQDSVLVDALDVVENVQLSLELRGHEQAAAAHWIAALGLAELDGRAAGVLSGGERQRLAVARALASAPDLVLLDEPTSQLDEANAERLGDVLREAAAAGLAIVCATHDPVLKARAHRVIDLPYRITPLNDSEQQTL